MRIVKAKFGYQKQFTEAECEQCIAAAIFRDDQIKMGAEFKALDGHPGLFSFESWYSTWAVDLDKLPTTALGRHFEIEQDSGLASTFETQISGLVPRETTVVNQRVNVAVPGIGLLQIKRVEVRTDLCTEELQRELDRGWQILAICPQPDQRRPDYVLGKTTKEDDE